ncbi:alpha/beta hydrolase [Dyadobacter chenwenxiniae]|uniref:Alpha/beta hydrolase n=1 Tax=Dyadobacter chenwenxiniae TaxID=2906456 RepID=A0A9X1PN97_9BACT|nr:alpha/beta hydrolase [Dyadobacter chenwenxiniae]MCF0064058.1 alpha/beta hydrolase [Dyadobacter chenwenxiniae]UON82786.1 alpha/beta hydrolase [Dyadobacter chenwenxiniae]
MKKLIGLLVALALYATPDKSMAQNEVINLWPEGKIPNFKANTIEEKSVTDESNILRISGVSVPTMTAFIVPKEKATGAAVMICPGGGYGILAASHEGSDFAKWFNDRGISAFVLKYRLPSEKTMTHQHEVPLMDAMQAMKLIRQSAGKWNIDVNKIGVMGFSAGGHLAATLSTHFNKGEKASPESKPNFSILIYPVISLTAELAHGGSRENLLGAEKSDELIRYYSNELQVSTETPPAFLVHAMDDTGVPPENSIAYYLALKKQKIPSEMHLYPKGGHGYGMRTEGKGSLANWPAAMDGWLKSLGYVKN